MDLQLGVLPADGVIWRLQGTTSKCVTGHVTPTDAGGWLVRVVRDYEALLTETYPDASSAVARAGHLRDGLISKGWLQVPV